MGIMSPTLPRNDACVSETAGPQYAVIIFILTVLTQLMKYLHMPIPKSHTIAIVVLSWGRERSLILLSSANSEWGLRFAI